MKKSVYLYPLIILFLTGCATTQQEEVPVGFDNEIQEFVPKVVIPEIPDPSPELQNVDEEVMEEYVEQNGVVFAKTEFEGVLKTSFVRLKIEDKANPERSYQLHIGEKAADNQFPWSVKTVNPGYFYIELPEGDYTITSISIPVGSTTAEEPLDIRFNVQPNGIVYLGTLRMVGTKEKIKLGGELPLIKPGFEFEAEVKNEFEEAKQALHERFPNVPKDITPQIMQLY